MDQLVIYSSTDNSVVNTISKETIRFSSNTNSYLFFNSTDKAVISSRFSADGVITIPVGCYSELLHDVETDKVGDTAIDKILIKFGLDKKSDADKTFENFAEKVLLAVDKRRKINPNFIPKFIRISEEFYDKFRHWFVGQYPYSLDLISDSIFIYGIRIYLTEEPESPTLVTDTNEVIGLY